MHPRPTGRHIGINIKPLILSFELRIFLCADMFPYNDFKTVSVCLSVCSYPEKSNNHSFVNISPTLVIDTSMERSSRVLQHGNPKIWFFSSKKLEIWILICDEELKSHYLRQYQSYISNWYIHISMERFSRVLHRDHGIPKIRIFFQKSSKLNFDLCWRAEILLASSISVLH